MRRSSKPASAASSWVTRASSPGYILFATALATLVASGSRFSLAAFVVPIEQELGTSRALLSAVAAVTLSRRKASAPTRR